MDIKHEIKGSKAYLNHLTKKYNNDFIHLVSGSFEPKCSVKVVKNGEHCPEKPTKEINGEPVCDKCYENWKYLQSNNR